MIYALVAVIVAQSMLHYFERKDLYNRIGQHVPVKTKKPPAPRVPSAHDRVLQEWKTGGEKK